MTKGRSAVTSAAPELLDMASRLGTFSRTDLKGNIQHSKSLFQQQKFVSEMGSSSDCLISDLMAVWGGLDEESRVGSRMRARTTLTPETSGEFGTGAAMVPKFT